ncbi:E3 ubiquitin-protein ligase ORTHRUS 2-like [Olea europaea var. sylvestris]|uniref:RING-type E3 ubiquitin transferase n=1 Tax=Olea europaea subsp. europaea TaxID=158383 RepID=A0A8S0PNQ9_OLEEU|nr:E3 ubiquitin-protein ligase ORTHRUS 2-like [Olea europaea var. sylvestris]CAA2955152.1 E3 ubiquitin- ligase ORTHRUS 2-like [Olea europaea subsp. europaea]
MANVSDLPCDADGVCMVCKKKAPDGEILTCKTCVTPWHSTCLSIPLKTLADAAQWECPDCSFTANPPGGAAVKLSISGGDLVEKIRAIESNPTLTDREKAKQRQELLSGEAISASPEVPNQDQKKSNGGTNEGLAILGDKLNCSICMQLLDRPVSTPCGHNFCLKCFQKWVGQGKLTCAICRKVIPSKMAREPRINSAIVMAIRNAKMSQSNVSGGVPRVNHFVHNKDRPDKAYTTERAKKSGKANACSGKIFVTVPLDHFGPITAEHDPERNLGVLVGETWEDRMECRQWGAHFTHVAGIAGQSEYGAQSVALSGGYEDDEDHGEWFLYTGSGGRDLSGNKRTNKKQSFDQKFDKSNEALRVSCKNGYPVRVVRSHKEKRSSYAPQEGVRYDGIYRIEKCWRKSGIQGFKVCRYLFVRCDNDPAPWTSDNNGDCPRELPTVEELKHATDITERKKSPAWDFDEGQGRWIWKKPAPESRKVSDVYDEEGKSKKRARRQKGNESVKERLLKEFGCLICRKVMVLPLTTPCAHNFCKGCLENAFAGQSFIKQRTCGGTRTLRAQKNVMKCPSCSNDVSDFLQNPQVNRELMNLIESLQSQMKEENMGSEDIDDGADEEDDDLCDETDACIEVNMGEEIDGSDGKSNIGAENKNCDASAEILMEENDEKEVSKPLTDTNPQSPIGKEALDRHDAVSDGQEADVARGEMPKRRNKRKSAAGEETCTLAPNMGKRRGANKA